MKGPQLELSKAFLHMHTYVGKNEQDSLVVWNSGSSAVFYEWRKVKRPDYIMAKKSDGIQRFFCHYPRSVMLPGEEKVFTFSFWSVKPGVFNEEWELITDPPLNDALPVVALSGDALEDETDLEELARFD